MAKSQEDQIREAWEREDKRAAQEKHQEKLWSEIEDGIASHTPKTTKCQTVTKWLKPQWAVEFERYLAERKK